MYCLYSICSFSEHFEKHGWALSQPIFEKEGELSDFVKKLKDSLNNSQIKQLVSWKKTGGGGSRWYADITGLVDEGVSQKIKFASEGIITPEYDSKMFSILMGGSDDVQDPHLDGKPKMDDKKNVTSKGVSVVLAIKDDTFMNVYDLSSIKYVYENGSCVGKSIEYKRVFVPKGKAFYFNSFTCYHGGDKYDEDNAQWKNDTVDLCNDRHIRFFGRYTITSTWDDDNNFNLTEKEIVKKICKGMWVE